ncbi:MAG: FxsA family protein [Pseudomonadota bacterium]
MLSQKQTAQLGARRPPIGLLLLAAFILVPLAEIAVLIEVGGWLGLWPTLGLIVLTAVIGAWMLRRQGLAVLRRAQQQMQQGSPPVAEVFEGFCLVIAGALLLTPGFLTDSAGGLLLLPPVRKLLYHRVRRRLEEQILSGAASQGGRQRTGQGPTSPPPRPEPKPPVTDVAFEEVDPKDMPEPRGSWSQKR